jgi:cation diffusion facilitator CzcD-associated flavoprotein CzcO
MTSDPELVMTAWLADFDQAICGRDADAIAALFRTDGYWRDLAGFTWDIRTVRGPAQIGAAMTSLTAASPRDFAREVGSAVACTSRPEPWRRSVDSFITFRTDVVSGRGYVKLVADGDGMWRAWTVLTTARELQGRPERTEANRPLGTLHREPDTWHEQREIGLEYRDRDPEVLVLGAGHSGLGITARLTALGVDTLLAERNARVGDNWRQRYRSLNLPNEVWANHLPYLPTWPVFCSKDKLADWLECYATALDLNVWTSTVLEDADYDEDRQRWTVVLRRAEEVATLHPLHLVLAIGVVGRARLITLPGAERFAGTIVTSQDYASEADTSGRRVLIIGTGSSAHDIAQDYCASGAEVTMLQRGSTCVFSVQPSGSLAYALYHEGGAPVEDADMIAASTPIPLGAELHRDLSTRMAELDAELIAGLERAGFRTDYGPDGTGFLMKYYRQGGGYYVNVGASDLIVSGQIKVISGTEVAELRDHEVEFTDGRTLAADAIVVAAGYGDMQETVRELLGDRVAARVGPVWGLRDDGEVRGLYYPTGQPGLWIMGGSLVQCRLMSRILALQITASLTGVAATPQDARAAPERAARRDLARDTAPAGSGA